MGTYTGEQVEAKRGLGEYNRCEAAAAALCIKSRPDQTTSSIPSNPLPV